MGEERNPCCGVRDAGVSCVNPHTRRGPNQQRGCQGEDLAARTDKPKYQIYYSCITAA